MSKKCNTCGMEYDDSLEKCPNCSKAAEMNVTKISPDAAQNSQNDVKEAAAEAAQSIKKAVKAAANSVADKASAAASDVMNSEAVKEVKSGKLSHKTIGIIAVIVAVIVVIGVVIGVIAGGNSYTSPVDHICKGIQTGNYKDYFKALPNFVISEIKYEEDTDDYKEMFADLRDELRDEYGRNYKVTYTVREKDKVSKSTLKDIRNYIEDQYDKKVKVTEGYDLTVKLKIKGSDGTDKTETTIRVYKINGKWCVLGYSGLSYMFY